MGGQSSHPIAFEKIVLANKERIAYTRGCLQRLFYVRPARINQALPQPSGRPKASSAPIYPADLPRFFGSPFPGFACSMHLFSRRPDRLLAIRRTGAQEPHFYGFYFSGS